jgi:hypothetical protein
LRNKGTTWRADEVLEIIAQELHRLEQTGALPEVTKAVEYLLDFLPVTMVAKRKQGQLDATNRHRRARKAAGWKCTRAGKWIPPHTDVDKGRHDQRASDEMAYS